MSTYNVWRSISDGSVISAIPDSAVLDYTGDTFQTGNSVWSDNLDTADMSITGDPQSSTLSDGAAALDADGIDDHGAITLPSSLSGSSLTSFSVEFAIQYSHTDASAAALGTRNDNVGQWLRVYLNNDESGNQDNGNLQFILQDGSDNRLRFSPSTNPGLNDGSRHDVSIIINDSTVNDGAIIIDGTEVSLSFNEQQSPSSFGSWQYDCAVFAVNREGAVSDYSDQSLGILRWHDTGISEQTISSYS